MVTARAMASDIKTGLDAGVDDYITKPFDPQDLLDRVGKLLKAKNKKSRGRK